MPIIFTLRLLPDPPTDAHTFQSYLAGLQIKAFDRSVAEPSNEVEIGTAVGPAAVPAAVPADVLQVGSNPASLSPSIVQHFENGLPPILKALATAIVVVKDDAVTSQRPEFPDPPALDLRLEITRGSTKIRHDAVEFNILGKNVQALSANPMDYMGIASNNPASPDFDSLPTGAYVIIPAPRPSDTADPGPVVFLDPKGAPPEFGALVKAIDKVLAKDHPKPATATSLAALKDPLTAPQAAEIAAELVFNRRVFPLPTPRIKLEDLYTGSSTDHEQERVRFEGALTAYYATRDADAEKLKRFVYAVSAAVLAERNSFKETKATLTLPIDPTMSTAASAGAIPITLTSAPGAPPALNPSFVVPAAYFYALGLTFPANQKPEKLYEQVLTSSADFISNSLSAAVDSGSITEAAQETVAEEIAPKVTVDRNQSIRRLTALSGSFATKPKYKAILQNNSNGTLAGDVAGLVGRWLAQTDADSQLISTFWPAEYGQKDYLELVLQVISDRRLDLESAVRTFPSPGLTITRASDLIKIKDEEWISFFVASPGLLPDSTKPGNTDDRARAYVQFLRTLFSVTSSPVAPIVPVAGDIPSFGNYQFDILAMFMSSLPGGLSLDNFPDDATIASALAAAFPDNQVAQAWVRQALTTLHDLYVITKGVGGPGQADQLRFSCMEALFARGFGSTKAVLAISSDQFRIALQGTVAWGSAQAIYDAAVPLGPFPSDEEEPDVGFQPVNPGNLVDCIPPAHLSPLGPVQYLQEALRCESGGRALQDVIKPRRGDIEKLLVSKSNLELRLPQIDLVNESLEFLGFNVAADHGTLYDTEGPPALHGQDHGEQHERALVATPQHSTPAVPVAEPTVYDHLKSSFTDPILPYPQHLDINRSYLQMIGSNRFETMRRLRRDITEFAIDPPHEPPDFQRHRWRYPLRFDIALEYLQVSPEEYQKLFSKKLEAVEIAELYGYNDVYSFLDRTARLPNFLQSTGLEYCEFYELWQTQFEPFKLNGPFHEPPACPPCCSDKIIISFPDRGGERSAASWGRLMIFVRLWRRLQSSCNGQGGISFSVLSDICTVLRLFDPSTRIVNPDFIRQLASLLVLRRDLSLPWTDGGGVHSVRERDEKRTQLLAIWVGPHKAPVEWAWAVPTLLSHVQVDAEAKYRCPRRPPEFAKILSDNLGSLSRLAGFTDDSPWYLNPSCTLRFAEVLAKIFASEFTVGEITFLFTTQDHLRGDDPYPYTEESEAQDDPLNTPEDDMHGLWELRRKLLCVNVSQTEAEGWTWARIQAACVELGFRLSNNSADVDALTNLGSHFFSAALESGGHRQDISSRRFSTPLTPNQTSPELWSGEHCKAFHYARSATDPASGELWTQLPLDDRNVLHQLAKSRQLSAPEAEAVRDLYFAPRAALAPFALIFENFARAVEWLVHEPNVEARFGFFRQQFALFYHRCKMIASHLAERVNELPGWITCAAKDCGCGCDGQAPNVEAAWRILRNIIADENTPLSSWEDDSGQRPQNFVTNTFSGSGFAALLGLIGIGLLGKISTEGSTEWRELRGGTDAFGCVRNVWNSPIPTYIPSLLLSSSPPQDDLVALRNGYALEDDHGSALGGAEPFVATWTGSLLVEEAGEYTFYAGHPEDCCDGQAAQLEEGQKWLVTLQRGQKIWTILNRCWKDAAHAPGHHSRPLRLSKGSYAIVIRFDQSEPKFTEELKTHQFHTGFQVRYCGPDTGHARCLLPHHRLFQDLKEGPLGSGLETGGSVGRWLNTQYYSSFRDIKRTYQRAFKAVLFSRRFHLSAHEERCNGQSELDYILDHPDRFLGSSYYLDGPAWKTHLVYGDFNFLPVTDSYYPPDVRIDSRVNPSAKRKAALFDWWERLFDYTYLRSLMTGQKRHKKKRKRSVLDLFYEADTQKPPDAHQLVRYFNAEISLATQILTFFISPDQQFEVRAPELLDERWAIRVAKASRWLADVKSSFYATEYEILAPALAASDDPGQEISGRSGNSTLVEFATRACEEEPSRTDFVRCVNDGLRERGRAALLAYLCSMDRVPLSFALPGSDDKKFASRPQDLGDLLLQDVEVGILQRASRVEDAIQAVQTFVQRARIGLEPTFPLTREFSELWECRFSSFQTWQAWKRRSLYRESWIYWDDLRRLKDSEGFSFFGSEISKGVDTLAGTARSMWWPSPEWPDVPGAQMVTAEQYAVFQRQKDSMGEGLPLMATPDRHGRPTLIAPQNLDDPEPPEPPPEPLPSAKLSEIRKATEPFAGAKDVEKKHTARDQQGHAGLFDEIRSPPLWLQSTIRMGTRFIRVAASGLPTAFPYTFDPTVQDQGQDQGQDQEAQCCKCGQYHAPSIDEYYFWLSDGSFYSEDDAIQKANHDVSISDEIDPTSEWDDPQKLPSLLHWPKQPTLHLFWARMHRGSLDPPRRSDDGIQLRLADGVKLSFIGRSVDSLLFTAANEGRSGFRYDLPTDSAVVTPQVVPDNPPAAHPLDKFLSAYPLFLYFAGGKPLEPLDSRCVALELARRLKQDCKYEAASLWCRKAFDVLNRDNSWMRCPKPSAASLDAGRNKTSSSENLSTPPSSSAKTVDDPFLEVQTEPERDVTCCSTGPFGDGVSRARAGLLEYLDILLQWVDSLLRRNSTESFRQAVVVADSIQRLLGPTPTRIKAQKDESALHFFSVGNFKALPAPLNPKLLRLYDEVVDRKAVIHDFLSSSRLRNGKVTRDLAVWGSSTRLSTDESFAVQSPGDLCSDAIQCCLTRCQPYRFTALIPKALEWAAMVKGLGSSLMAAFEKGDSEYLSTLRASHEHHILSLRTDVAQNNFRAADWDYQGLGKTLAGAQTRARYYQNLIEKGVIALELGYQQGMETAMMNRIAGNVEEAMGQGLNMIPDFYVGFPASLSHLPLGTKLGYFFSALARIQNWVAENNSTNATLSETQASWLRRAEDWQHQLNVTEIEIEQIKRQQLAAARRRHVALTELNNHQRQLEHSQEVDDFLRDRFTKHELYNFLQQETSVLYKQAFRLALQSAVEAQAALRYELGDFSSCHQSNNSQPDFDFSENALWNSLHEGLLAGEKLELGLRALERKYMTSMCREYELTKHISLRQIAPFAFLQLKTGEECEIEVPEWWFDLDYPGHYMRRLKQVSLSLPCVAGPFTGVHCRLQLLSSKVRVTPFLPPSPECCCATTKAAIPLPSPSLKQDATTALDAGLKNNDRAGHRNGRLKSSHTQTSKAECISCRCGSRSKQLPQDPYVLHTYHTSSSHMSIATSTGTADTGLFDANLEQTRYLPFEFAGADSCWRISLPAQNNAFNLDTLSDVVMHVTYTSREGGQELHDRAEAAVCGRLLGDGVRFLDVKHDMAEAFHAAFIQSPAWRHGSVTDQKCAVERESEGADMQLKLAFTKKMFPYTHGGRYRDIWITKVHVFMEIMEEDHCVDEDHPCYQNSRGLGASHAHFDVTYLPSTARRSHDNGKKSGRVHKPQKCRHASKNYVRKTSHFNDLDGSSSSSSSSESDDSECDCHDNSAVVGKCRDRDKVKFTMLPCPSPCHSSTAAADCSPTTYYGILNPTNCLGPVTEDRNRAQCAEVPDLGSLVFSLGEREREREVEAAYLLVEYEIGECRVLRGAQIVSEGIKKCHFS
ncbi:MAG: hypothetical protein LQ342_006846 [Letrouitia transgressa]|nr:MAG: hypothetical protein LQ342_006846 [Letrouitia transgressa]